MDNKKNGIPKLRFPGFTGAWEQRKLGEVAEIKTGSRNHQDSVDNGKYPFFVRSEKVERLNEYDFDTKAILVPGDGRIGEIFHYYDGKFALHQRVYKVDNFKEVNPLYLLNLFKYKFKKHALRLNAQGTVPSLRLPMFTNWNILIPNLNEQQKIGLFFQQLDSLIALHQRKLEHLQEQKKGLLQKMFPKNGETVPEVRFPGFTDAWEQRKLGEVADIFDGTHQTPKYTDSGIKFVSVENIATLETEKYISQKAYESEYSNKQAEKGDVLMTRIGNIGTPKLIEKDEPLAYYVTLALLKPKNIDSNFLAWGISSPKVQRNIWKLTLHIAFPKKINLGEINQVSISIPSINEQKKIGDFFKQLDSLIALHQRKLDHLELMKKGLLQQMFV